jgi:hypothetical protein
MNGELTDLDVDEDLFNEFPDVPPIMMLDAALATVIAVISAEHSPELSLLLDPDQIPEPASMSSYLVVTKITELRYLLRIHLAEMKRALPPTKDDYLF